MQQQLSDMLKAATAAAEAEDREHKAYMRGWHACAEAMREMIETMPAEVEQPKPPAAGANGQQPAAAAPRAPKGSVDRAITAALTARADQGATPAMVVGYAYVGEQPTEKSVLIRLRAMKKDGKVEERDGHWFWAQPLPRQEPAPAAAAEGMGRGVEFDA